jgi:hypothetical protein
LSRQRLTEIHQRRAADSASVPQLRMTVPMPFKRVKKNDLNSSFLMLQMIALLMHDRLKGKYLIYLHQVGRRETSVA